MIEEDLIERVKCAEKAESPQALFEVTEQIISLLDAGKIHAVSYREKDDIWSVNIWIKEAILRYFKMKNSTLMKGEYWDKIPLKFEGWTPQQFQEAGIRVVPGAQVRYGAFIGEKSILMPSFVNIGAYVGQGTMVDTWATVGSCAYVGQRVHISGGAGIGGVLEPLQAMPVVVEDDCFIGARSEIAEGVRIGRGSVVAMGTFIGLSTKIVERETGSISYGYVPPFSVVVPGSIESKGVHLSCAIIVKKVDEKTRQKTSITELLRS